MVSKNELKLICEEFDKIMKPNTLVTYDDCLDDHMEYKLEKAINDVVGRNIVYYFRAGISKLSIIIDNKYVIKVGLDFYDEGNTSRGDDDIWSEVNAEVAHLFPEIFIPIQLFYRGKNRDFFIQNYVIPDEDDEYGCGFKGCSNNSLNTVRESQGTYRDIFFDSNWYASICDTYGNDYFFELCEYLNNDDTSIRDSHSGNYGYTKDGKPVYFDYAY